MRRLVTAAILVVVTAGCGSAGADEDGVAEDGVDEDGVAAGEVSGELVVFAAASLTDVFDELSGSFVDAHPDVEVVRNHAGSQTLASQLAEGAPADVFASADTTQMDAVDEAGALAAAPERFASNALEIAVEPGNPRRIRGLEDLADPELVVILPADEVPAGRYAREALDEAGLEVDPASLERDVRAARSKVELGEADAAIVYASDVVASDAVDGVRIPAEQNVAVTYHLAVLAEAANPAAAEAFVAHVRSDTGRRILAAHGFGAP